jgi:hypothetical protein
MKPISPIQNIWRGRNQRFPITDYNYRPIGFSRFNAGCWLAPGLSFLGISRDYFRAEARHNFIVETILFALITITTVPAIVDCGRALFEFVRAIGSV